MSTTVYRMFDADDELLYVGITLNPPARFAKHKQDKPWWTLVKRIELMHHETREAALSTEKHFIETEKPLWNVVHRDGVEPIPWKKLREMYPQIARVERVLHDLPAAPEFCSMDFYIEMLRVGEIDQIPEPHQGRIMVRLARRSPDCAQDPCPSCGEDAFPEDDE